MPSLTDIDASARTPFSFELYPPRGNATRESLWNTIQQLALVGPDFISVTYGAGGSSRSSSLDVLRYIQSETTVRPLAHLTCVGSTHAETNVLIREFLDEGITSFLALRGDPPAGSHEDNIVLGDLGSAAELVQLIHRVQSEREQYRECAVIGAPHARRIDTERNQICVAVAAFPNGHPRSRSKSQDVRTLLAKQAAGATVAITQLFFDPDDYLRFVDDAHRAGVEIPILPGIMPITSPSRLRRVVELSGEECPPHLFARLEAEPTDEGRFAIGVEYAADLASAVLVGGAPGVHLYAFNQHETVLAVLSRCGLIPENQTTLSTTEGSAQ